jgi:uncharacterized protein YhbP (UPF0306 family)
MNVEQTIRDYLASVIHASVAAVGEDGKPWAFEVHYAFDENLNLYWVSEQLARHSQDVVVRPRVAGTVVKQHGPSDPPLGVSFEGTVEVLHDVDDQHLAFKTYVARFPGREQAVREAYAQKTDTGRRIYKVAVSNYYLNGVINGKMGKEHLSWPGK